MDSKDIFEKFRKQTKDLKVVGTIKIKKMKAYYEPKVQKSMSEFIRLASNMQAKARMMTRILYVAIQKEVNAVAHKANVAYAEAKPVVVTYAKRAAIKAHEGGRNALEAVESKFGKVHFNFRHFVMTSGVAAVVFALTFTVTGFNRSKVQAETLEIPEVETFNKEAIDVNYGDESAIVDVAKEILSSDVSAVHEAKKVTLSNGSQGYEIDKYIVEVDNNFAKDVKEEEATLTIQTKDTYAKEAFEKVVVADETKAKTSVDEGIVHTYKVKVNYVDTQAPSIALTTNKVEIDDVDNFHKEDYVASIIDNYDGVMNNYTVEGGLKIKDEERWEAGEYQLVYSATDTHGNVGKATLNVKVNKTEEEKEEEKEEAPAKEEVGAVSSTEASGAESYEQAGSVAAAAMAQIGVNQDCTMLVTNALRAVGINFHSAPAGYMSLGTVVSASEAQAGDIIYYADGGAGVPHVAIYIGGGQAVHGGYLGTTKVASAFMGSGIVFIRIAR